MIGRRGVLGVLLGAPAVAAKAMEAAANEVEMDTMPAVGNLTGSTEPVSEKEADPLAYAARRFLQERERKAHRYLNPRTDLPHGINGKRSWSPVFKEHCFHKDFDKLIGEREIWEMDRFELIQFAYRKGFKP